MAYFTADARDEALLGQLVFEGTADPVAHSALMVSSKSSRQAVVKTMS